MLVYQRVASFYLELTMPENRHLLVGTNLPTPIWQRLC